MKILIPPNLEVDKMIGLLALEESSTTRIEIIYLDFILSFGQHYDTIIHAFCTFSMSNTEENTDTSWPIGGLHSITYLFLAYLQLELLMYL